MSVDEFVASRQLGTRSREPQDRAYLDQVLAAHGIKRNVVGWVSSFSMLPHLIAGTDLLAAFPRSLANRFSHMGIRVVEPPFPLGKDFSVSMAWPARVHHNPPQRWLRKRIVEIVAGQSL
jgi:DNA-binding transcriptional LysR family regulator